MGFTFGVLQQRVEQLRYGLCRACNNHLRCNLVERDQDEGAVSQSWMRNFQSRFADVQVS